MAWYDTGTVSVTNGSTTITGAGTNFVAGVQVGEGFSGPDGRIYEIQAVVSATALTLADPYLGSTQAGQDYKIVPTQSLVATLASQVSTLISDFQGVVDEAGEGKFSDGTATSAGITFLQDQDTGFFRPAANQIGMTTSGVQRALLTSTGLNSTIIGATTPAAGTFTNLTGTADATLNGVTVGKGAGNFTTNTAVGNSAFESNTSGVNNTTQGFQALQLNTTGSNNTAHGYQALQSNLTGVSNTAVGLGALKLNTSASFNTAVGREALRANTTGNNNTAHGYRALYLNTSGVNNTAVGYLALESNTEGNSNTAQGFSALISNTTGVNNTAQGYQALQLNIGGDNNTAMGLQALKSNISGTFNTALGRSAGSALTTGDNNTIIGSVAGTAGLANTVIIGAGPTERMRIDSSGHAIIPGGVTLGTATGVYLADKTLDDYEEGTWTPDLNGSTTDPTYTHVSNYTKIGNLVTVHTSIVFTTVGSGNYFITAGSLPFTRPLNYITGTVSVLDAGTSWYTGVSRADNSTIVFYINDHQQFASGTPFTVAPTDRLSFTLTYQTTE